MSQILNTNIKPYNDDFDPSKNYYQVLYKAGYPIQARELNVSQSITQDQISEMGKKFLAPGDVVTPGEFSFANPTAYVKISQISLGATAEDFIGISITGVTSKVKATVIYAVPATADDAITFFVKYQTSGSSQEDAKFNEGEKIKADSPSVLTAVVGVSTNTKPVDSPAMGFGCLFSTKSGSYFVDGFVVRNYSETIVVSKYTTNPTAQVGFIVTQSFVTSEEDSSLLDNSQGTSNFAAPGADRLKIDLTLSQLDINATIPNFVRLATIVEGNLQGSPNQTIKWDWLYQILARRTYNESGNYIVKDFSVQPMEYVNSNNLSGLFNYAEKVTIQGVDYYYYPPVPGSGQTDNLSYEDASSKYVLNVGNGTAYVQGFEVGYDAGTYQFGDKARDIKYTSGSQVSVADGPYFEVTHTYCAPDVENSVGDNAAVAFSDLIAYRNFIDGYTGDSVDIINPGAVDSYRRPKNTGNPPLETYHVTCDRDIVSLAGFQLIWPSTGSIGRSAVVASATPVIRGQAFGSATVTSSIKIPALPMGVLRPKYFTPSNLIFSSANENEDTTFYDYESSFKLGVMAINYFTYITVTDLNNNWKIGNQVEGESSGAIGVLEFGSEIAGSSNFRTFIISNVIGEFREGENITQSNIASARIFKDGEIGSLKFTTIGDLSVVNTIDVSTLGQRYILKKTEFVATKTDITLNKTGRDNLYKWVQGLSTNSKRLNYTLRTDNGIIGYAYLPNPIIKTSAENVKSIFSTLEDTNDFSCDISSQNVNHLDRLAIGQNSLFSGVKDTNYLVCDNYSGDSSSELIAGDIITFVDNNGNATTKQVLYASSPSGYGQNRSPSFVYLTTTLNVAATSKRVERVRCKRGGSVTDNSIYQLSQTVIRSLESTPNATGIEYKMHREFYANFSGLGNQITITSTNNNHRFYSTDPSAITVVVTEDLTNTGALYDGRAIVATRLAIQEDGTKLIITIGPTANASGNLLKLKIIAPVSVTNAKAKKKNLVEYKDASAIRISSDYAVNSVISLGRTDVFRYVSAKIFDTSLPTPKEVSDVTDNYFLDDGQRDNFYDLSRLILKPGYPAASFSGNQWELRVVCSAFNHSNDGEFFSVDSYTHSKGIEYSKIPVYFSASSIADNQRGDSPSFINLRDCVDFRPSVNSKTSKIALIEPGVDEQDAINFRDSSKGGNADTSKSLVSGTTFKANIESYLPRIDSLFLDIKGQFKLKKGISTANPKPPEDDSLGIRLYDLILPPYTFSAEDIYLKKYNYRRYTMADISSLDRRITRVEDYVSLSLLEQSALNTQVRDSVTGLDRFKNGFIVDPFANHVNGQTNSPEYRCSIDPKLNHLRAPHFTDQVELEENNQIDPQRAGNLYAKTGDLVTLPYKNVEFAKNPFATRTVNLQPFSVFVYDGEITLDPPIDTWQEIRIKDKLVIEDNSLYNAMLDMSQNLINMGMGTVWGDWETTSVNSFAGGIISFDEAQRRGLSISDGGGSLPFSSRPVRANSTTATNQTRTEYKLNINPNTSTTISTSQGERVVDMQVAKTMRSVPVFIQAYRLKPNTRYYAFFDGIDVTKWVSSDNYERTLEDGKFRFTKAPNTLPKGFGTSIITDDVGTFTGVFLVPNGYPPLRGQKYSGDLNLIQYETTALTRSFDTGSKKFRLTTNPTNGDDVKAFAETTFTASGIILDKQETIISTRIPDVQQVATGRSETRTITGGDASAVAYDPVAQTFLVDNNNADGLFVTELDIFFAKKDKEKGVMAYLVSTSGEVPTQNILPFSKVIKNSDSILRVKCVLGSNITTETITAGTVVVGQTSGARGVVRTQVVFNDTSVDRNRNVTNTVYNLILDNYLKEFIPGEDIVPEISPRLKSIFSIVKDEVTISRIDVTSLGTNVANGNIIFSSPDLPGGVAPVATLVAYNGKAAYVKIASLGSGYTSIPKATPPSGTAVLNVRVVDGQRAVEMGVATSEDASAATTFRFESPVYLMGNTTYGFVLKSPNSLEYEAYVSKLGENIIGTETRVVQQPLLGSIFRSQNGGLWTEDQTEDIMFTLRRAEFETNSTATISLQNVPLHMEQMETINPIETTNKSNSIKVYKSSHGHVKNDWVLIDNVSQTVNGIPPQFINGIHQVTAAGFNHYMVSVGRNATSSGKGGSTGIRCTVNRPFEVINIMTGSLLFKNTESSIGIRVAGSAGLSGSGLQAYILNASDTFVNNEISHYYPNQKQCASYINEAAFNGSSFLQGRRSVNVNLYLSTSDSKLSPVYDITRTNAVLTRSLINMPKTTDSYYGEPFSIVTFENDALNLKTKTASFKIGNELETVDIDEWNPDLFKLRLSGQNVYDLKEKIELLTSDNKSILKRGNSIVSISTPIQPYFVNETQSNGSVFAKWISREFKLENSCDGLEVKMTAVMYERNSIRLYYTPRPEGYDGSLYDANWIPFNPINTTATFTYDNNGLCNNNSQVRIRTSDTIDPRQLTTNDWTEYTWSAQNIPRFSAFMLKIVMTATNTAKSPIIDDLRVICTE